MCLEATGLSATPSPTPRGVEPPHKLIITGTGRSGTTFLVQLLTALGLPTGYDRQTWKQDYHEHCSAGLEHDPSDPASPYIIKNPQLCVTLGEMLDRGEFVVDHALIPVRDLASAALSRIRIGGGNVPGGLVGTDDPTQQQAVLAERFHELVHTLVRHDIPHTFLQFPRFVQDRAYAFSKLSPVFPSLTSAQFDAAFAATAAPELVHTFRSRATSPSDTAARFRSQVRRRKRWRLARRFGAWSLAAAASVLLIAAYAPRRSAPAAEYAVARESAILEPIPLTGDRGEPLARPTVPSFALTSDPIGALIGNVSPSPPLQPATRPISDRSSASDRSFLATALFSRP